MRSWLVSMLAGLLPVQALAQGAWISVDAQAGGCPARADVASDLEERLPGVTRAPGASRARTRYRLEVDRPGAAALALRLRDAGGTLVLERRLAVSGPASREGCQALAEAAALVVARYLREIGYRSPTPVLPPEEPAPAPTRRAAAPRPSAAPEPAPSELPAASPPPPPASPIPEANTSAPRPPSAAITAAAIEPLVRASSRAPAPALLLGAGGAVRLGFGGGAAGTEAPARSEVLLGLQGNRGWLAAEIAGGVSTETTVGVPGSAGADLRLRAFPLRAAMGVPLPLLGGVIQPAVGASVELLRFRARGLLDARGGDRVEPSAELGLAYRAAGRRLFVRASLWGGYSLAPRDFDAGGSAPVFRTPAAYLRVAVEAGLSLWKN